MGQNGLLFSGQLFPREKLTSSALGAYISFVARSRHPFTLHSLRIGGHTFSPPRTWMRIWFSSSTPNHYDILPRTCCRQHVTLRHVFIMPIPFPRNKRSRGLPKILKRDRQVVFSSSCCAIFHRHLYLRLGLGCGTALWVILVDVI